MGADRLISLGRGGPSLAGATGASQGMDGMGKDEPSSSSRDQLSLSLITDVIDGSRCAGGTGPVDSDSPETTRWGKPETETQPPIGDSRKQLGVEKGMGAVCGLHQTEEVFGG